MFFAGCILSLPVVTVHPAVEFFAVEPNRPSGTRRPKIARLDCPPDRGPVDVAVSRSPCVVEVRALHRPLHRRRFHAVLPSQTWCCSEMQSIRGRGLTRTGNMMFLQRLQT